jgi:hypothetical protein
VCMYVCMYINIYIYIHAYGVSHKSVNLKHPLVLTGMFICKPASQLVEWYHSVGSCALNMEDLLPNNFL